MCQAVCALLAVALLAVAPVAAGQAKPSCTAPEFRQFDFWVGEWEVRDATGKLQGENRITRIHQGCVLLEEWRGAGGATGTSLNLYDATRKHWHQTWVDSSGGLLMLDGSFAEGAMTLSGTAPDEKATGGVSMQRIRWTLLSDGRVRQLWESSGDGGKVWTVTFEGFYQKKDGTPK